MFWARAGVLVNVVKDTLDAIFTLGGGIPVKGDPWKSFFMGNALLNVHAGPAYVAGGLGFSTKDCEREFKKGGIDLVGAAGHQPFPQPTTPSARSSANCVPRSSPRTVASNTTTSCCWVSATSFNSLRY